MDWASRVGLQDSPLGGVLHTRLERWLAASGSPDIQLSLLEASGPMGDVLLRMLATSNWFATTLVQNPEFASEVLDPVEISRPWNRAEVAAIGTSAFLTTLNTDHKRDRLRWLKQRGLIRAMARDFGGLAAPAEVWLEISDLFEGLLLLSLAAQWEVFSREKGLDPDCPLEVVAFGKLGAHELNLSSDVDLLFILPDGADEALLSRFATQWVRGVEQVMGRGPLARVDLRLRPFGSRGPLVSPWRSVESYYSNYSEPWEHLALIRSRMLVGDADRWERLRRHHAFDRPKSALSVEEILKVRQRTQETFDEEDIKRGEGGIRDLEFFLQIPQLLHGRNSPHLQGREFGPVAQSLADAGLLEADLAERAVADYTFLRQLEHRIQWDNMEQTHVYPGEDVARLRLAFGLGLPSADALTDEVGRVRRTTAALGGPPPEIQSTGFGPRLRERLAEIAPVLEAAVKESPVLTELLESGEIMEVPPSGTAAKAAWPRDWIRAALSGSGAPDAWPILRDVLASGPEVLVLGSFAQGTFTLSSDLDLLLLDPNPEIWRDWMKRLEQLPFATDLRLRPEGRQGSLIRSREGLRAYAATDMEGWERIALTFAEPLAGHLSVGDWWPILFPRPLTKPELDRLLSIKQRVETERVNPKDAKRQLKLGPGGIDDLAWLVGISTWRTPEAFTHGPLPDRLRRLHQIGMLNAVEIDQLLSGFHFLVQLRRSMVLHGCAQDKVPENPDILARLAKALDLESANILLSEHQRHREQIRNVYLVVLDQMGLALNG